jgi:hypothetical protein
VLILRYVIIGVYSNIGRIKFIEQRAAFIKTSVPIDRHPQQSPYKSRESSDSSQDDVNGRDSILYLSDLVGMLKLDLEKRERAPTWISFVPRVTFDSTVE